MQAPTIVFGLCLILAFAVPSWGGKNKSAPQNPSQQTSVTPAPVALPGGYVRNPADIKERQQYLKNLQQKAKEAAANRAAAKAKQAGQQTTAPPQKNTGGLQ